jgi:tRNA 2-selenouridine synthase
MTLTPESSARGPVSGSYGAIESLAGVFHPHAIEIQDFPYYSLVIDLRSAREYADDHIPGAVRLDPTGWPAGPLTTGAGATLAPPLAVHEPSMPELPTPLAAAVAHVRLDQAILVYCGQGGAVSSVVAQALRWRGWTVDVLLGGWVNYRRWVLAGLEVLPRLVRFRVMACTLGSESSRILTALRSVGHQVLDLEALAGTRRFALTAHSQAQPAQAWFDSQLLQALRATDPTAPVWVADTGPKLGAIVLPGALNDALAIASPGCRRTSLRAHRHGQKTNRCARTPTH